MTSQALSRFDTRWRPLVLFLLAWVLWPGSPAFAADEPDLIFRRSTVFKWVSPNDKLATYAVDDPEVEGVACHFTGRSLFFKKMQIVRGCDAKRNVLVYMVYSDRLIEGSPKNSTSSVPIMPWGAADSAIAKCGEFIQ